VADCAADQPAGKANRDVSLWQDAQGLRCSHFSATSTNLCQVTATDRETSI
jgi:hypothetical protein